MMLTALLCYSLVAVSQEPVLLPPVPVPLGDDAAHAWTEPFFPGATYDRGVADPRDLIGAAVGSRIASHAEILAGMRALAATSDRVVVESYGRSYEGRELVTVTITSAANHARMDEIRSTALRMWDPRGEGQDLEATLGEQPGIAWMGYGIHGDETSASEAALPFAYHLAACTDPGVVGALEDVVVVMDPCLNPDGRERIRSMVLQSAGFRANLDNGAMQRGRWPFGRGNHYLFDMNRDWMAGEAPETRGRWAALLKTPPQLFVDAHEMSGLDTFLFYPQTAPRNVNLPERLFHWQGVLADDAARVFDGFGWGYYTREWADALYPGYSDAWGSLTGAIGMLYEQGRTIGAPLRRESGEIVAYRESVHGQVAVSASNLFSFAANREGILRDYVAHRRRATDTAAPDGDRAFLVVPGADPERDAYFLRAMLGQGIEVERAKEPFTGMATVHSVDGPADSVEFPAGTWIVRAAQPQGAMVRAYLEFDPKLDGDFLQKERESLERGKGSKIYDVTGWDLGRQLGLTAFWADAPGVATEAAVLASARVGVEGEPADSYAWVADGADGRSLRFAARAMELGLQVHVSDKAFESRVLGAEGEPEVKAFARGSFLLRRHENPDDVEALVVQAAADARASVSGVVSGRGVGEGPDLGGGHFELLEAPRVALLSNAPVSTTDFGHVWRYLDQDLSMPVTLLDAQGGGVDLAEYNVLILPPGGGEYAAERKGSIGAWVEAGGTLIAIGSTAHSIAGESSGLSDNRLRRDVLETLDGYGARTQRERASLSVTVDVDALYGSGDSAAPDGSGEEEGEPASVTEEDDAWARRFSPAGVILRGEVDPDAWITTGTEAAEMAVLFAGSRVLMSNNRPAVRLVEGSRLRLAGLVWPEARERIADSAWLTVESRGRGQVISFAASPVFRGSWRGTARLLGNAIVVGPGMTQ